MDSLRLFSQRKPECTTSSHSVPRSPWVGRTRAAFRNTSAVWALELSKRDTAVNHGSVRDHGTFKGSLGIAFDRRGDNLYSIVQYVIGRELSHLVILEPNFHWSRIVTFCDFRTKWCLNDTKMIPKRCPDYIQMTATPKWYTKDTQRMQNNSAWYPNGTQMIPGGTRITPKS